MILLIDNYDSFAYNLFQMIGERHGDIRAVRNDRIDVAGVAALNPSHIVLSPGPGRPADAGICEAVITELSGRFPILGVCLGFQALCEAYGGRIVPAHVLMHGKQAPVDVVADDPLLAGLGTRFDAGRYHSLAAEAASLPPELTVTSVAPDGEVMSVRHASFPTHGVQFHPESILTPLGGRILDNFLAIGRGPATIHQEDA